MSSKLPKPAPQPQPTATKWTFTAERGYFAHDSDTETWGLLTTTRPSLGLLPRAYPSDTSSDDASGTKTQWERFAQHLWQLNAQSPPTTSYKLLYIVRHGQSVANLKEKLVRKDIWDEQSRTAGDGSEVWQDAALTALGERQARDAGGVFSGGAAAPRPEMVFSSPLRRCLRTTEVVYGEEYLRDGAAGRPRVKEGLRGRFGVFTSDRRSSEEWIRTHHGVFEVERGFAGEDALWEAGERETEAEHVARTRALLRDVFVEAGQRTIVSLTTHSSSAMAIFEVTGWKKLPLAAGAVYPLLVKCTTESAKYSVTLR